MWLATILINPFYMELIPVSKKSTSKVISYLEQKENYIFATSPEGTRKKIDKWRSGWHVIASKLKSPVIICGFDYSKKEIVFDSIFEVSDYDTDLKHIQKILKKYPPKYPNQCSLFTE